MTLSESESIEPTATALPFPLPPNLSAMNNVESIRALNDRELSLNISGTSASWHARYSHSSVIYIGGLASFLTEGDVLAVFDQLGTTTHLHLPRDGATNAPRGFCFLEYADARSAVLAVDNFNGAELYGRVLRVDHVERYKRPDASVVEMVDLSAGAAVGEGSGKAGKGRVRAAERAREGETVAALSEEARKKRVMERLAAVRAQRRAEGDGNDDGGVKGEGGRGVREGVVAEGEREKGGDRERERVQKRREKEVRREERRLVREERDLRRSERDKRKRPRHR